MDIQTYLTAAEKRYGVKLKTVVPLDDEAMDVIERIVQQFYPISIGRPKKTILQKNPLDFTQVKNAEVYVLDMVFAVPTSPYVLARLVSKALGAPEAFVIARGENDPTEHEGERLVAIEDMDAEAEKRGLKPAPSIMTTGEYPEADMRDNSDLTGNAATSAFLAYVGKVSKEKAAATAKATKTPHFSWLKMPTKADTGDQKQVEQDDTDFNRDIKDAPKVKPSVMGKMPKGVAKAGNLDNDSATVKRAYTDENGKTVVLTRSIKGLRGE